MLRVHTMPASADLPSGVVRLEFEGSGSRPDWALWRPASRGRTCFVYIHGHGSDGRQLYHRPDVRDALLPELGCLGWAVLTPNLRGASWMCPAAVADLDALIDWLWREQGIERIVLAGGSMGGSCTLIYAALRPAAIAMCPATDVAEFTGWCLAHEQSFVREMGAIIRDAYGSPAALAAHVAVARASALTMPLFLAHGDADVLVPVEHSRKLAAAMARYHSQPAFTYVEVPGGDHEAALPYFTQALQWVCRQIGE